jgi:hypothetical protein
MQEPRNSGLCTHTLTLHQLDANQWPSAEACGEPGPISRPSLYNIAHIGRFLPDSSPFRL